MVPRLSLAALIPVAFALGCEATDKTFHAEGTDASSTTMTPDSGNTMTPDSGTTPAMDGAVTAMDGATTTSTSTGLPCAVDTVLVDHCQLCHASTPRYGAPMPLVTWADTQKPAVSDPTKKVYELMAERIRDANRPMPPTGDLSAQDQGTILSWVQSGASMGATCSSSMQPMPPMTPPIGPAALPCTPTAQFTAHDSAAGSGFAVPATPNLYECFTFKSPFSATQQGIAWAPIIDDARVLHHWILFSTHTPQVDGGFGPCNMPGDAVFLSGWAPGGGNWVMPSDVSLQLPGPGDSLILQVHYHNAAGYTGVADHSGVAMCTTDTPRQNVAGFFTLGTIHINIPANTSGYVTSGTCPGWATNSLTQPVTALAAFPHMHTLGRKISTDVIRANTGSVENLVHVDRWNFENQTAYSLTPTMQIHPGDSITTTCTYDNTTSAAVNFGERTEDEMCFDFVMIYPITLFGPTNRSCGLF
jgi:hypothetical protein